MNPVDLSMFVFGIYVVIVVGIGLVAIPNKILTLFGVPTTSEVWIRTSLFSRFALLFFLVIIVLLKQTRPTIIIFGVVDAVGALWTLLVLLNQR